MERSFKMLTVRIPAELHLKLKIHAATENKTIVEIIIEVLKKELKKDTTDEK